MASILERVRAQGNPLIDGSRATFVWQGERPPQLAGDFNFWQIIPEWRWTRDADGLWLYSKKLAPGLYVEYGHGVGRERVADPFNPRTTFTGLGWLNNYFVTPGAAVEPLGMGTEQHRPERLRGVLTAHRVATVQEVWAGIDARFAAGDSREVLLYQPPVAGPVPLLVLFDGVDFVRRIGAANLIDDLIAAGRIRPIAVAFVAAADAFDFTGGQVPRGRELEYGCSLVTTEFVRRTVMPLAEEHLRLVSFRKHPGVHGIGGISLGAEQALFTAMGAPQIFGNVLCLSGLFSGTVRNPAYDLLASQPRAWPGEALWGILRRAREPWAPPRRPLKRLWLQCGRMEVWARLTQGALAMTARGKRYRVKRFLHPGGHNWTSWMNALPHGLEYLFGRV